MSRHFPKLHRVIIEHSVTGELLNNPVATYIKAREFDEWCDEVQKEGYDVLDDGMYERLMHTPHGTEVWCYSQWRLAEQEVVA